MENNDELKEISIKICTCYDFYDTIEFKNFYLVNNLVDEKSLENILIYNITCKNLIGGKSLCIRFI